MTDVAAFLDAAVDACIEIDKRLSLRDEALFVPHECGAGGDVSMGFDLAAEAIALKHLGRFGRVVSEESGEIGEGAATIVLDPLDGSDNYASGFPLYGVSVALEEAGETTAALVCDLSARRCFVRAGDDHVVFPLYARSLKAKVQRNPHAKVGIFEKARNHPKAAEALVHEGLKFRVPGAVALSFAYAHYVNYVLFFGTMRAYDMQAGLHLCRDLHRYVDDKVAFAAQERSVYDALCRIFEVS